MRLAFLALLGLAGTAAAADNLLVDFTPTYAQLRAQALKESKPLVAWVGYGCPSTAHQLPGMLHHHQAGPWTFPGGEVERGPAALVFVPAGDGSLYWAQTIQADRCCAANIRAAVNTTVARWEKQSAPFVAVGGWSAGLLQSRSAPLSPPSSSPPLTSAEFFRHLRGWSDSRDGTCAS